MDNDKFVRIFPSGDYKKVLVLNDDVDKNIFKIVLYGTLNPTWNDINKFVNEYFINNLNKSH